MDFTELDGGGGLEDFPDSAVWPLSSQRKARIGGEG